MNLNMKNAMIENRLILPRLKITRKLNRLIGLMARKIVYRKGLVQDNKVFFMTYDNQYSCNLRYIADEIIRQGLPLEMVWVVKKGYKNEDMSFPEQITLVERGTASMFEEQSSAKIWFDNALNCVWYGMPKKKEQIYINTWHGSMGIKKLSGNLMWRYRAKRCRKITDYCISNSVFEEGVYRDTFWPESKYLRFGHARNDILMQDDKHAQVRKRVHEYFGISEETRCVLYAPTFRDDKATDCFDIDFEQLRNALEAKRPGKWCILVRMHFKNRNVKLSNNWSEWLKDASDYPDMQDLLVVADMGITDYSSWAYDYVITKKPLFIYAVDIEKYNGTRGFYYPLETTPFPICRNNDELSESVKSFDNEQYQKRCDAFLIDKGCAETGEAAKRIVDFLKTELLRI